MKRVMITALLILSPALSSADEKPPTIAERGAMGLTAYTEVLDALDVPAAERFSLDSGQPAEVSSTLMSAMERARAAQKKALEGEDRRFGYFEPSEK